MDPRGCTDSRGRVPAVAQLRRVTAELRSRLAPPDTPPEPPAPPLSRVHSCMVPASALRGSCRPSGRAAPPGHLGGPPAACPRRFPAVRARMRGPQIFSLSCGALAVCVLPDDPCGRKNPAQGQPPAFRRGNMPIRHLLASGAARGARAGLRARFCRAFRHIRTIFRSRCRSAPWGGGNGRTGASFWVLRGGRA